MSPNLQPPQVTPSLGKNRWWVWLLCWVGAGTLLFLTFRQVGPGGVWEAIQGAQLRWLVLAMGFNLLILPLWVLCWQVMLPRDERVGFWRMGEVVSLTALAQNTMPLPLGHVSAAVVLSRHGEVGKATTLSVLATQEVAEGVAKVAVLLLAASLAPLPSWMRAGAGGIALGAGGLALSLALVARFLQGDPRGAEALSHPSKARLWVAAFAQRLELLREGRRFSLALTLLLGMKGAEALAILCAQRAFGVELPLTALPAALGAVMLASLVPFVPANVGTYEAGATYIYHQMGVDPGTALAMALAQHLTLLAAFLGAGYTVLTLRLLSQSESWSEGRMMRGGR